jgi:hypothetical protein
LHAVLTSIIDVQGERCFRGLGEIAQVAFQKYMAQLQTSMDGGVTAAPSKHLHDHLKNLLNLLWIVESPLSTNVTPESMFKTYWNPMCAGTILGYIAHFANLHRGLDMVDSSYQLRIVLHLFHGLVKCGALSRAELPLLDLLQEKFATCKAVWGGALPEREDLVLRWWMGYGLKKEHATHRTYLTLDLWRNIGSPNQLDAPKIREMKPIMPDEKVESESEGKVDEDFQTQRKPRKKDQGHVMLEHEVRVLLAVNLAIVGDILNRFVNDLSTELGWEQPVKQMVHKIQSVPRPENCQESLVRRLVKKTWNERHWFIALWSKSWEAWPIIRIRPSNCQLSSKRRRL